MRAIACAGLFVWAVYVAVPEGYSPPETVWTGGPVPKYVRIAGGFVTTGALALELDEPMRAKFASSVDRLQNLLGSSGELTLRVEVADSADEAPWPEADSALARPEGYWIQLGAHGGRIVAADTVGVARGIATVTRLAINSEGRIPAVRLADWPDHQVRALHFVLRGITPEDAKRLIDLASVAQFNTVILHVADAVRLESLPEIARADAWAPSELSAVAGYARSSGMEVVPELKLLTHQEKLLKTAYPDLLYNSVTVDPYNDAAYTVLLPAVDEVIRLTGAKAFHIGHDEVRGVAGRRKRLGQREQGLPPALFLRSVELLHAHLAARGIRTWMWGDMFLLPTRFPKMAARHLHGDAAYASLLDQIPRDIVICDWHYTGEHPAFPSASAFARAGHPVLGATWKDTTTTRNFSRYVASMPSGGLGMIATTWSELQEGNYNSVERIIETSGAVFWNASSR